MAQAVAGHASLARRMDLGFLWRRVCRKPGPHLGRHARRTAAAEGCRSVDTLRGTQSVARQLHGQLGRVVGNMPAGTEARMGAPVRALEDRKSTRLNSSHRCISYAVFCLK